MVQQTSDVAGTATLLRDALGQVALQSSTPGDVSSGAAWSLQDRLGSTVAQTTTAGRITDLASYSDFGIPTFDSTGIELVLWVALAVVALVLLPAEQLGTVQWGVRILPVVAAGVDISVMVIRFARASGRWFRPLVRHIAKADKILIVIAYLTGFAAVALIASVVAVGATSGSLLGLAAGLLVASGVLTLGRSVLK